MQRRSLPACSLQSLVVIPWRSMHGAAMSPPLSLRIELRNYLSSRMLCISLLKGQNEAQIMPLIPKLFIQRHNEILNYMKYWIIVWSSSCPSEKWLLKYPLFLTPQKWETTVKYKLLRRSQWSRGLSRELSSPAQALWSCIRIPLEVWMSLCV
jgi:hypothetical protein